MVDPEFFPLPYGVADGIVKGHVAEVDPLLRDFFIMQFSDIARTSPQMDHRRALQAAIKGPPAG